MQYIAEAGCFKEEGAAAQRPESVWCARGVRSSKYHSIFLALSVMGHANDKDTQIAERREKGHHSPLAEIHS